MLGRRWEQVRSLFACALFAVLLLGCGPDDRPTLVEPRVESTVESAEVLADTPGDRAQQQVPDPAVEAEAAPVETPEIPPDAGLSDPPQDEAPPTLALVPLTFVVAPNASVLGVPLGASAEDALVRLTEMLGEPDVDSGWYEGCPLDAGGDDERLVQWGDLNVYFDRLGDGDVLAAWGYDLRKVAGGFPEVELVLLPGGATLGDPINDVAFAAGLDVVYDEDFDINRVGEAGYEIVSEGPPGAPSWGAFVPAVPTCE